MLLIGAGGAAAGVLGPLIDAQPREIVVANRTRERAAALVERHRVAAGDLPLRDSTLDDCGGPFDLVVNSSSSSMQGLAAPVPDAVLRRDALAIDLMYGAAAQPFLEWARAHGAQARDGLGMLVEQAAEAFFFWRGVRPPRPRCWGAARATDAREHVMRQLARLLALLLVAMASLQVFFVRARGAHAVGRPAVHHLPAQRVVAAAPRARRRLVEPAVGRRRTISPSR